MSLATCRAVSTGISISSLSLFSTAPLRSYFSPSNANGVLGQKYFTSGTHMALMFSSEGKLTVEKASKKMSELW